MKQAKKTSHPRFEVPSLEAFIANLTPQVAEALTPQEQRVLGKTTINAAIEWNCNGPEAAASYMRAITDIQRAVLAKLATLVLATDGAPVRQDGAPVDALRMTEALLNLGII